MTFEYYGWSYFKIASTPCIFFPVKGARQVLIYSHANHEDMWREHTVLAKFATSLNIAVLAYEYPGYSGSEGSASEETVLISLDRVYRVLTREFGVDASDIILMGRSIGTGVSCQFAARHQLGGLILVSPFTSIRAVVEHGGGMFGGSGASSLISERFDSLSAMSSIQCPTLIFHGEKDEMCPVDGAQELIDNCAAPSKHLERFAEMDHDNVFLEDDKTHFVTSQIKAVKAHIPLRKKGAPLDIQLGANYRCTIDVTLDDKHWAISQKEEEDAVHMIQMAFESINQVVQELGNPEDQAKMVYSMLRMIFHATDKDHNEKMEHDELLRVMKCFEESRNRGEPPTRSSSEGLQKSVQEAFEMYDITSNGALEFYEFVEFFCHTCMASADSSMGMPLELIQQVRLLSADEFMQKQEQEQQQHDLLEAAMHEDLHLSTTLTNDLDRIGKEMELRESLKSPTGSPKSPSIRKPPEERSSFSLMGSTDSWW